MGKKPKKWTEVYPQGTKEGNEEQKLFIALARNSKYDWRSVSALAKESGLSEARVEEILNKYFKKGIVLQNKTGNWAYWERVPQKLNDDDDDIVGKDHKNRVDVHLSTQNP